MAHILVLEDDLALSAGLCFELDACGHLTVAAYHCEKARQLLEKEAFDLALFDVNLPDGSGFDLCREVKEKYPNLPVLFLTANDLEEDVLKGFDLGADDYITKPFNPVEMLARVRSQLRRYLQLGGGTVQPSTLVIGGIRLDDNAKAVTVDGENAALTPKEYDILRFLMKNAGTVFSPSEIYRRVWDDVPLNAAGAIAVHIRHLREKIEINPSEPRYIKVVWGKGYKMEGGIK